MSLSNFGNINPVFQSNDGTKTLTIDRNANTLTITNSSIPKTIIINSQQFSNGTQVLPYTQMYEKVNAVNASVYPAPDSTTIKVNERVLLDGGVGYTNSVGSQEILMSDGTNEGHYRADFVEQINTATGNYWSNNTDTLQVNNTSNPSYINCSPYNGFNIQNDVKGGSPTQVAQLTYSQLQILDPTTSNKNAFTAYDINIQDSSNINHAQLTTDFITFTTSGTAGNSNLSSNQLQFQDATTTIIGQVNPNNVFLSDANTNLQIEIQNDATTYGEPYIRLQNTTGLSNTLRYSGIYADGHNCFNLNNDTKFFKQANPFSFSVYTANDSDFIEKSYPFVLADNLNTLRLYNPTDYLDDNGNAGWSCIVSNLSGGDITIDTSGYSFYSHANGLQGNPIIINKWSTARITLVFSPTTAGDYLWAVSCF